MWWAKQRRRKHCPSPKLPQSSGAASQVQRQSTFTQSWVPGVLGRVIRDRGIAAMAYLQNPEDL